MADDGRVIRFTRYEDRPPLTPEEQRAIIRQQIEAADAPPKSLQEMLYEQAGRASAFFDAMPPLTRRQRWAYRVEEVRRRCRRAWGALRGRDDD